MRIKPSLPAYALVTLAVATGCGGKTTVDDRTDDDNLATNASLLRSADCNSLLNQLRADARVKINAQIDAIINVIRECTERYGDDACGYGSADAVGDDMGAAPPRSGGEAPSGVSDGDSANGGSAPRDPSSYTETNTQVAGVDEADIVKSDGTHFYVLHGSSFRVVQAWPVEEMHEVSAFTIEGMPSEMFVEGDLAVIFSTVDGNPIYEASGQRPRNPYGDQGDVDAPRAPDSPGYPGYSYNPLTKITVLRIAADKSVQVAKETYLEGSYLSSRRVGQHVRTVIEGGRLDMAQTALSRASWGVSTSPDPIVALELIRSQALAQLANIGLEEWLPRTFDKEGDTITAAPLACHNTYTPTAGSTPSGLTQISTLDLNDLAADTQEVAVFGYSRTVYGNANTLVLAAESWNDQFGGFGGGAAVDTATPSPGANAGLGLQNEPAAASESFAYDRTHLHQFTFGADGAPVYQGSGTVDGSVHNQFSLDERDGILRVATTETRGYRGDNQDFSRDSSFTHVRTMRVQDNALVEVGSVRDLAPGERIYSVRYVGNKAYVVTFRQVDPLFVIDLSDAAAPRLLGELKIPGFSEYMHPLDDTHLLTIGREATDDGMMQGLALQIFDVSQPTNPQLAHKFVYDAGRYGSSEASYNHKAFTFFAEKEVLAFPYTSYNPDNGDVRSTLELFHVNKAEGFTRLGELDHSTLVSVENNSCYYVDSGVRRGLFIEDVAYSLSFGGIFAKPLSDLAGAAHTVAFPSPYAQVDCGYGEDVPRPEGDPTPDSR